MIITGPEQADEFSTRSVYVLGEGEASKTTMTGRTEGFTSSAGFRSSGDAAFEGAGIGQSDFNHLMIYDAFMICHAFAQLPLYSLEDLGLCKHGEAAVLMAEGHATPGGSLPVNTNGGELSHMDAGMYALQASKDTRKNDR